MSSGTPSEVSDLSMSDTESFANIQLEMLPSPTTGESAATSSPVDSETGPPVDHSPSETISRHAKYYFDDGTVIFVVGGLSYRLHKYIFSRESPHWANTLVQPVPGGSFQLDEESVADFDAFLAVLYSTCYRQPDISTAIEWSAVLRLATKWSFADIRQLAIERLEPIASPIEKIVLSHSHTIPQWLPAAYTSLCKRTHPLTAAEIRAVQAEDVALIMSTREALLRDGGASLNTNTASAYVSKALRKPKGSESTKAVSKAVSGEAPTPVNLEADPAKTDEPSGGSRLPDTAVATPSPSHATNVPEGGAVPPPAPISSPYPCTKVTELLGLLETDICDSVADEIIRWIANVEKENSYAALVGTIDLIFDKAASDSNSSRLCVSLCSRISGTTMFRFSSSAQSSGGPLGEATPIFKQRLLEKCLAEMNDGTTRRHLEPPGLKHKVTEITATRTHEQRMNIARFCGELLLRGIWPETQVYDLLSSIVPGTERAHDEHRVQLLCTFLTTVASHLRRLMVQTGTESVRQRMSRYISIITTANGMQVSSETAKMTQNVLEISQSNWLAKNLNRSVFGFGLS